MAAVVCLGVCSGAHEDGLVSVSWESSAVESV